MPTNLNRSGISSEMYRELENQFRTCVNTYGFDEIKTPILEPINLYNRSLGETTDVVQKEMFEVANGVVLRPEGTAGVIRSYLQNKLYAEPNETVRLFYTGEMFRKERPQAGRYREFTQLGVEAIGKVNSYTEAEIILLANSFLKQTGLESPACELNSIGCSTCRPSYLEQLKSYAAGITGLCKNCETRREQNPFRLLDCKQTACQQLLVEAPQVKNALCGSCETDFREVKRLLTDAGVRYTENSRLVRGLDYYEKTVFEFRDNSIGSQSALCGGGRYNGLVERLGGPEQTGFGFAIGLERLMIALTNQGKLKNPTPELDYYLIWTTTETRDVQFQAAKRLRDTGFRVEMTFEPRKMKKQLSTANRKGARYALILGENELAQGVMQMKNLATGEQTFTKIGEWL